MGDMHLLRIRALGWRTTTYPKSTFAACGAAAVFIFRDFLPVYRQSYVVGVVLHPRTTKWKYM